MLFTVLNLEHSFINNLNNLTFEEELNIDVLKLHLIDFLHSDLDLVLKTLSSFSSLVQTEQHFVTYSTSLCNNEMT